MFEYVTSASAQLACNMIVQHVQVCWEMRWPRPSHDTWPRWTVGFFSFQIHWEVISNLNFLGSSRNSNLLITSQWIWIEKIPTAHLHCFIHRVRQNARPIIFLPYVNVPCQFVFKILNLKTVDLMMSHDFCQRISWKIAKGNVWAKFHIPTGCGRCINIGFQKIPN